MEKIRNLTKLDNYFKINIFVWFNFQFLFTTLIETKLVLLVTHLIQFTYL